VVPYMREMAAVLACGVGAVVSHRSAGALWQLLPEGGGKAPVDVTILNADRGSRSGIRGHCVCALAADEVTRVQGLPVTTTARTLLDLVTVVTVRQLEQALAQAETQSPTI